MFLCSVYSQNYEKFSLIDGFQYDLMMVLDSGLLFWGHPVCQRSLCHQFLLEGYEVPSHTHAHVVG